MPSKLNTALDVPTTPAALTPVVPVMPAPRVPKHDTDVDVVQLVVAHSASESTADWERSVGAKFMPVSVVLATNDATLYGADAVTTGAEARHMMSSYKQQQLEQKAVVSRRVKTVLRS